MDASGHDELSVTLQGQELTTAAGHRPMGTRRQNANAAGEVEFTKEAAIDLLAFRLRWYDRWLKGDKNGVDEDAPVLLYIMGTGDDRRSSAGRLQHGGFWRAEREWPLARIAPTPLYLNVDGTLSSKPPQHIR